MKEIMEQAPVPDTPKNLHKIFYKEDRDACAPVFCFLPHG